jgi:hypothetical protein
MTADADDGVGYIFFFVGQASGLFGEMFPLRGE